MWIKLSIKRHRKGSTCVGSEVSRNAIPFAIAIGSKANVLLGAWILVRGIGEPSVSFLGTGRGKYLRVGFPRVIDGRAEIVMKAPPSSHYRSAVRPALRTENSAIVES